ncbi:periplasmic binding protein [Gluconacetobacter diazotrophicus PA1 5]|uniref:Periplasmic binding protein n=2 Tax=Gluconacetobacter diazotrophicus TaxID=33996 RepID=A9HK76_GLUDA|nr:ABC transporter substrate-binding protein [Gluconacetobacter diazotrophicus]ACI50080.1 periplasmic binding protein [Gluconacetobacter diazotrophicus PA1 5]MBB2156226.1 ABC transporter substrate-binding protein [Gluconacetobacter diazotrophicus]TWB07840.1 iron complex transport system substrate-binding protein [Gluconacetobacter diazotrophicus]CAP56005.1 Periplasmic binding protein [Gluconacetobacter diazotrophicus PA1 5]
MKAKSPRKHGHCRLWRTVAGLAAAVAMMAAGGTRAATITDLAGRSVDIPAHVHRIILGEGRLIYALAPLEKSHLFDRIVGWQGEFRDADVQSYDKYVATFPAAAKVALIGKTTADTISPEKVLDLRPDLAILSVSGHGPAASSELVAQLQSAHVPVVFVDFRAHPLDDTVPSMRILGAVLDRRAEAEAYIAFYQAHLDRIRTRVATLPQSARPTVFLEMLAGTRDSCCHTAGNGNMGAFIDAAGGRNIAAPLLPGYIGDIALEQVIAANPDIYIVDGTKGPAYQGLGVHMGAETDPASARASVQAVLQRPGISTLSAVKDGHAYGLWHSFYDSPYNILAVEVMAKWFHPDLFRDVDPEATRTELYARFLPVPNSGTYWVSDTP